MADFRESELRLRDAPDAGTQKFGIDVRSVAFDPQPVEAGRRATIEADVRLECRGHERVKIRTQYAGTSFTERVLDNKNPCGEVVQYSAQLEIPDGVSGSMPYKITVWVGDTGNFSEIGTYSGSVAVAGSNGGGGDPPNGGDPGPGNGGGGEVAGIPTEALVLGGAGLVVAGAVYAIRSQDVPDVGRRRVRR